MNDHATTTTSRGVSPVPRRSRARYVLGGVGVLLLLGAVLVSQRRSRAADKDDLAKAPTRRVPVLVEEVARRDVPIVLEGLGTVTPLATVTVKSQIDGRLDRVVFTEGKQVKRGEVIAQIDPRPFRVQHDTAAATLARDQAQLTNAQLNLERMQALRSQNLIAQQQLDDQAALVAQVTGTVGIDRAMLDAAKLQLDYARITSPIDGIAGIRQVDPGNLVHPSDATGLVVLTQLDPIAVIFSLPQDELGRVALALSRGPVKVEAYSRDGDRLIASGTLKVLDNEVNPGTATLKLKAQFVNAEHLLWPNQFVKARLLVDQRMGVMVIAAAAIQRGPKGAFVYVVAADASVSIRPVEVESVQGTQAIIERGLAPGEKVVTDGQNQLKPGARVDPRGPGVKEHAPSKARRR